MVIPGLGQIFKIDLETKQRAGVQWLLAGTECSVGAFLDGLPVVIRKCHLEIDLSDRRGRNVLQISGNVANSDIPGKGIAGRNTQVRELNRILNGGSIGNFGEFGRSASASSWSKAPSDEDCQRDKHSASNNDDASAFHVTLR